MRKVCGLHTKFKYVEISVYKKIPMTSFIPRPITPFIRFVNPPKYSPTIYFNLLLLLIFSKNLLR